jgi:hypothetical protein
MGGLSGQAQGWGGRDTAARQDGLIGDACKNNPDTLARLALQEIACKVMRHHLALGLGHCAPLK